MDTLLSKGLAAMKVEATSENAAQSESHGMSRLLSIDEAKELTQISRATLYREVLAGRLGSVLVDSRRRIPIVALNAWMVDNFRE